MEGATFILGLILGVACGVFITAMMKGVHIETPEEDDTDYTNY